MGSAVALTEADWNAWTEYVRSKHSCRMYALITLTGTLALRAGEAAMLRREDIQLESTPPQVKIPKEKGRGKSPGSIPLLPEQVQILLSWIHQGIHCTRTKKINQHCEQEVQDSYYIPSKGRLFESRHKYGNKKLRVDHLGYHAIWAAVRSLAEGFIKERPHVASNWRQLRSHSGRSTKITMMLGEGVSLAISMAFARHSKNSIRTHLLYGKLTSSHIHKYLAEHRQQVLVKAPLSCTAADAAARPPQNGKHPLAEDVAAPARRVKGKQSPASNEASTKDPLQGCTLNSAVAWYDEGKLNKDEFEKVKCHLLRKIQ